MSLPYYQMYPKDFDVDERVRLMDDAQLGLYLRLLNSSWMNDGIPGDAETIKRMLPGTSWARFAANWAAVEPCFPVCPDGRRRNPRQEKEREIADIKIDRRATANRKNGAAGGRPPKSDSVSESSVLETQSKPNGFVRASGSVSGSVSGFGFSGGGAGGGPPSARRRGDLLAEEAWAGFVAAWGDAGGAGASGPDWDQAALDWGRLDFEQRIAAVRGLALRKGKGDPALTGLPGTYLAKRKWERDLPQPLPQTRQQQRGPDKADRAMQIAKQRMEEKS